MPNSIPAYSQDKAAQVLADFLKATMPSEVPSERRGYGHIGATLSDTVLQAGLNYRSVVMPRVEHILATYPNADTTTAFWNVLCAVGAPRLLQWSHPEKINRLDRLVSLLRSRGLETEADLRIWLASKTASSELLALKGIGPKTVDYLKILVGIPTVAVDRHVKELFLLAGIHLEEYEDFRTVTCMAAELLSLDAGVLDGLIWQYFSTRSEVHRGQRCNHGIV